MRYILLFLLLSILLFEGVIIVDISKLDFSLYEISSQIEEAESLLSSTVTEVGL